MTRRAIRATVVVLALLAAKPALATFHVMVIDQLFPGFEEAPAAQYVMLRLQAPVQTAVYGQPVTLSDAEGGALANFAAFCPAAGVTCSLPRVSPACSGGGCPTPFEANHRTILVATRWAQDLMCVTADLLAAESLPYPSGRVCFGDCSVRNDCGDGPVDCLAYGSFAGNNGIFGAPAVSPMLGEALVADVTRQNQFIGGALLDNSVGFAVGTPVPQNFHGDMGNLSGIAGDADGNGGVSAVDLTAATEAVFVTDRRCGLAVERRGTDANFDTRVGAADLVAALHLITTL